MTRTGRTHEGAAKNFYKEFLEILSAFNRKEGVDQRKNKENADDDIQVKILKIIEGNQQNAD